MKQKVYPEGNQRFSFRAFTLIEVLVVIAIIGLLASIIMVSIKKVRERARVAAGLNFASQVHHALGASSSGIWDFDENADNTCQGAISPFDDICDSSGNNNHGQRFNATWVSGVDNTPSSTGYALSFDGNDYVNVGTGSSLQIENSSFTIEAWIKPANNIPTDNRFTVISTYSPGWIMGLPDDGNIEGYRFYSGSGSYKYTPPGGLISLEWTHFVVTRNISNNQLKIYINGQDKQTFTVVTVTSSVNPVLIGRRTDCCYFNGLIDNVHIYSEALSSAQIKKLYVEGAKLHGRITKHQETNTKQ